MDLNVQLLQNTEAFKPLTNPTIKAVIGPETGTSAASGFYIQIQIQDIVDFSSANPQQCSVYAWQVEHIIKNTSSVLSHVSYRTSTS